MEFALFFFNIAGYLTHIALNFRQTIPSEVLVDYNVALNSSSALKIQM